MAPGSVVPNFLTKGLHKFTIIGPGSGEPVIQDFFSGKALAFMQRPADPSTLGIKAVAALLALA